MNPVDQNPLRPKDEPGVPRRFRSHGEAFVWAAGSTVRLYGARVLWGSVSAMIAWLAWSLARYVFPGFMSGLFPSGWSWIFVFAAALAFLLALWAFGSVAVYVYLVLAGGVLRRDER